MVVCVAQSAFSWFVGKIEFLLKMIRDTEMFEGLLQITYVGDPFYGKVDLKQQGSFFVTARRLYSWVVMFSKLF